MTRNQKVFCDEYLIDLNGTRAYKVAYKNVTKDETAAVNASRLLRNANVKAYIDKRLEEVSNEKIADLQEVMERLTIAARGELKEDVVVTENKGDYISKARVIEKNIGAKEQIKALELLGKRYAAFVDRKEIDATVQTNKLDDILNQLKD